MTERFHDPFIDKLSEPIGYLVILFAHLERQLDWSIGWLLRLNEDERAALIARVQSFVHRVYLFDSVATLQVNSTPLKSELAEIIKGMLDANTERNNIIHGPWEIYFPASETARKRRTKGKGKISTKPYDYSPTKIITLAHESLNPSRRLGKFTGALAELRRAEQRP